MLTTVHFQVITGHYQLVIDQYQVVNGHYQVIAGQYQVMIDQYRVSNGHYQGVAGQYQEVIDQYQVVTGQYEVVIDQYQVVIDQYQVVTGQYQVVMDQYTVIIGQYQGRLVSQNHDYGHETGRRGSDWAETRPKWILWVRCVHLNPFWCPKRQDLSKNPGFRAFRRGIGSKLIFVTRFPGRAEFLSFYGALVKRAQSRKQQLNTWKTIFYFGFPDL